MFKDIESALLRANPDYVSHAFGELRPEELAPLEELRSDPDAYGVLRPQADSGLTAKSLTRPMARLLRDLRSPGRLPDYLKEALGERCGRVVAELVMDKVLEIGAHGAFVSGADAVAEMCVDEPLVLGTGVVPELSLKALKYGQELQTTNAGQLSARLYFFHRLPNTVKWEKRFPNPAAVAAHLGVQSGGRNRAALDALFERVEQDGPSRDWFLWEDRRRRAAGGARPERTFKLYVSPAPDNVAEAFRGVLEAAATVRPYRFKVGGSLSGLLRPDKIVLYFLGMEDLKACAAALRPKLAGCRGHGVPFTSPLGDDGLLSWGADPPGSGRGLSWQERESWRLWVTNRLAQAILVAKTGRGTMEPWEFALRRLRFQGVDTESWSPARTDWFEHGR